MKKIFLAGALIVTMGIGAFSAYADSAPTNEYNQENGHMNRGAFQRDRFNQDNEIFIEEDSQDWFDERQAERSAYRDERIQSALDEGWITEEEAAERRDELAERDRFEQENGYRNRRSHHGGRHRNYDRGRSYRCH